MEIVTYYIKKIISGFKKEYTINRFSTIICTIILLFMICFSIYSIRQENYENEVLNKKSHETFAVISKYIGQDKHGYHEYQFTYHIHKKKYNSYFESDTHFLKKGDSIRIKYSPIDPTVSKVINRYYYIRPQMKWFDEK